MAVPSQNILRRRKSIKPLVITYSIFAVVIVFFISVGMFSILNYQYVNGISQSEMEFEDYVFAISAMFSEHQIPLSFENVKKIFEMHLSIWWVYPIAVLMLFVYITSIPRNDFKGMEHGSAKWMDDEVIKVFSNPDNGIPAAKDFYVPIDGSKTANLNEIIIGGPGAGKSFRAIKPHILQMLGSYVITDPKGELYRDTARMLLAEGYKVRVLNLKDLHFSNSYNPFAYLTSEQDVVSLSDLFMKNTKGEGEKDDFWSGDAQKILTMIMMYLYKSETEIKTFGRVARLLNTIRYENGQIDTSCELARCMNKHSALYPNDVATVSWNGFQGIAQETSSSVIEVLSQRLTLFSTTDLDAITSTDEMDFDMVGVEKTVIFLIIPAARNTYKAVCNIFYSQLFERLMRVADAKYNGCLPQLVSCELDEFANIGEIPSFNEILSVVRSYNIRICIVLQGLAQLKAIYEKMYEAIIGNCDIFTLLGSKDKDTLEYVSEKLGKITVRGDSRSFNRGGNGGGGQDTEAYIERPLLYPEEIKKAIKPKGKTRKYGGSCIVFVGYEEPVYLPKFDTPGHLRFAECGSKFKDYVHNNTYIEKVYAPVWEKRLADYTEMYEAHFSREKEDVAEYSKVQQQLKEEEQQALEAEFEGYNVQINLPDNEPPSEKEYQSYCEKVDVEDYEPVPDFYEGDFEDDMMFDDVAPIVAELRKGDNDE